MPQPLQFFVPPKWRDDVITSYHLPPGPIFALPFATPVLQVWGFHKENYILSQCYAAEDFSVVVLCFSFGERTEISIGCQAGFNAFQYTLGNDAMGYMTGHGYFGLLKGAASLQYISGGMHKAWFKPGRYLYLYTVVPESEMKLIAEGLPELQKFIRKHAEGNPEGTITDRTIIDLPTELLIHSLKRICLQGVELNLQLKTIITKLLTIYYKQTLLEKNGTWPADILQRRVKYFIADNIQDPHGITTEALAKRFLITDKTLMRNWEKEHGCNLREFIISMRMDLGLYMLINEDITILEVADRLNYREASAFSRDFNRHFGFPPKLARSRF